MADQQGADAIKEDLVLKEAQQGFLNAPLMRQGTVAVVLRNGRRSRRRQ